MAQKHKMVCLKATGEKGLLAIESKKRRRNFREQMVFARNNTPYLELATTVVRDEDGPWVHPLIFLETQHHSLIGAEALNRKAEEFIKMRAQDTRIDILSIASGMVGENLCLQILFRPYRGYETQREIAEFVDEMHHYLGETKVTERKMARTEKFLIPTEAMRHYSDEEKKMHAEKVKAQKEAMLESTEDAPFLNSIEKYTPEKLLDVDPNADLIYDLMTKDMQTTTHLPYQKFVAVFKDCMQYIARVERASYYSSLEDRKNREEFERWLDSYIEKNHIATGSLPVEDLPALKNKLNRALYQLYVVQDLIDDNDITDIKITAPDSIRVRVGGKAYLSNVTFIDLNDYIQFLESLAIKNRIDLSIPSQTFTDDSDPNYILRFSITAGYVTGSGIPTLHVRKVSRNKLMAPDLIKAGMMDEKIRDYLIDCGKTSRGVVFAGPPGSGKTVMLNWFLEDAYESSAEILVIQENDELFTYRKGVMFEHVVNNPMGDEKACSLEDLGQMALVAGANVFVIGEAKGAEICSAITLSNSGCRTAMTIHSPSSTETIDKMADLALRGYANSYEEAKRMIKSFETIVYLQDFQVKEISQIIGYDEKKKDMIYRPIYRRPAEDAK